ncbi:MAG: gamma-glutamylcyclotransferase [Rhizobiales bacterium]|nr:gamma-glutamylcyclotransferase [Hyphomicrobiales bacterium]
MTELWVFGYGSLIWRPGFPFQERRAARLVGAHRALCVYSWVHRGRPDHPGLVLGLDRGGMCRGLGFRVAANDREAVVSYLREREQVTAVYLERIREIRFNDGSAVPALTFLVDRSHRQYAGKLDEEAQFRIVAAAQGQSGANRDYVINTAAHLAELGMPDARLGRLADRLKAFGPA